MGEKGKEPLTLLAATGGRPSDATTLRQHGATARSFAGGSRMNAMEGAINLDVDAGMEERCLRNLLWRGLSVFGTSERAEVLGLRAPLEPLRKTVHERSSGNSSLRAYTYCDREAKTEIPVYIPTSFEEKRRIIPLNRPPPDSGFTDNESFEEVTNQVLRR